MISAMSFGALGENAVRALSRGANKVTFLEFNKQAAKQLIQNAQLLKANNIQVEHIDALNYLKSATAKV